MEFSLTQAFFSLSLPCGREDSRGLASLPVSARRVASRVEKLFRNARWSSSGEAMRAIVALYLVIGVVLLAIGFLLPGPCQPRSGTPKCTRFPLSAGSAKSGSTD